MLKREVDRSARRGLDEALGTVGLRPFKGKAAAWRSEDGKLICWVVVDSKFRDPYAGGAFILEFEHSPDGSWMKKITGREGIGGLISDTEFADLVAVQNDVISSLPRPPDDYVAMIHPSLQDRYLSRFSPVPATGRAQFWMRYLTEDHLERWWLALAPLLPAVVRRAWTLDPGALELGKERQW